ncbi:hypothetical protein GGR53DRAFT_504302 [Hypoxylon sp. FL1150]|nr:hypothetical protein GGR53DRAFT_504302 [Hypoxylon sp. FL1150]
MRIVNPFKFGTDPWDPTHRFETSWFLPPFVLFVLRSLMSLYAFITLLFNIGYECQVDGCWEAGNNFSYFTVLTYWGIAFYLAFAAIHTFIYARTGVALLDKWPRPLQALHALLFTTVTTFPFLVTIVYWGILYSYGSAWFPTVYSGWSNVSQHALNSLFALFEIGASRVSPAPWIHALWLVVIMALYLALAYVTRATKGFYTYSFLDPGVVHSLVAAYICGIAVGTVVVFVVARYLVWGRQWLVEVKLRRQGKFAGPQRETLSYELAERGQEDSNTIVIK